MVIASLPARFAARVLGRDQADERGELAWVVEACQVAELGDDGERDDPLHAAQRLQASTTGYSRQLGATRAALARCRASTFDLLVDGAHGLLKHDLLRGGRTDHLGQVATMGVIPVGPTGVVQAEAEQERISAGAWRP